jgi:hypothetical protein
VPEFSLRHFFRERALWLLAALPLLFFYRPLTGETFFHRDIYLQFFWKRVLLSKALLSGQLPLWNPMIHGGQPLLASPEHSVFYPTNLLYLILPSLTALNVAIVLQFIFCAMTSYFLARVIGISTRGAFLTGVAYTFCGFMLSTASLTLMLQALAWPPALIACAHLWLQTGARRWFIAAAVFGALPLVAGSAETAAMSFALMAAWVLAVPDTTLRRRLLTVAGIVAFSGGLSLMQTLPAIEVIRNSSRSAKIEYSGFAQWSLAPQRLPELVLPGFFGPTDTLARRDYWGGRYEYGYPYIISVYFGAPLLLLAIAGIATGTPISRRGRVILAAFAGGGFVLAIGGYLPFFYFLYEHLPLLGIFRFPSKALELALLPIALLAGAAVERAHPRRLAVAAVIAVLAIGFTALFQQQINHALFEGDASLGRPFAHALIALALFVPALFWNRTTTVAAIIVADLWVAGWRVNPYADRELFVTPPLAMKVKPLLGDGGRLFRSVGAYAQKMNVPTNEAVWLAWWEIQVLARFTAPMYDIPLMFDYDYDGLAPIRIRRVADAVEKMDWPHRLKVFSNAGVTLIITPDVIQSPAVALVDKLRSPNGEPLYVYRDRAAQPLRFVARSGATLPATMRSISHSLNAWRVDVIAPADGALVFNDSYYPGWRMSIDGRDSPQLLAGFGLSSVAVPAGHHVVEKRYRPVLPLVGMAGSILTALLLAFWRFNQ